VANFPDGPPADFATRPAGRQETEDATSPITPITSPITYDRMKSLSGLIKLRFSGPDRMRRRFTRLPNAFSKKLTNLKAALVLHFAYYNFCHVHAILRVTPAMAVGITQKRHTFSSLGTMTA
jgi:hypothetical protein